MLAKFFKPDDLHHKTIRVSKHSDTLESVQFRNNAMTLFFTTLDTFSRPVQNSCPDLISVHKFDLYHSTWHIQDDSNPFHNHIIREDHGALLPRDVTCILNHHEKITPADRTLIQNHYAVWYEEYARNKEMRRYEAHEVTNLDCLPFALLCYEAMQSMMFTFLKPYLLSRGFNEKQTNLQIKLLSAFLLLLVTLDMPTLIGHFLLINAVSLILENFLSVQHAQSLANIFSVIIDMCLIQKEEPHYDYTAWQHLMSSLNILMCKELLGKVLLPRFMAAVQSKKNDSEIIEDASESSASNRFSSGLN